MLLSADRAGRRIGVAVVASLLLAVAVLPVREKKEMAMKKTPYKRWKM